MDWPCPPGVPIEANLPWLRTADGPDRLHFAFEVTLGKPVCARSFECARSAANDGSPCDACTQLEPKLLELSENARKRIPHTCHAHLTPLHLIDVIHEHDEINNGFKLQVCHFFVFTLNIHIV